jgi:SAM-dependent methyltransferase
VVERLTDDVTGEARFGHEARYYFAHGFTRPGDSVLDAACGVGYGSLILAPHGSGVHYNGVDIEPVHAHSCLSHHFSQADLQTWEPTHPFDVGVSFETIEHIPDYQPLVATLKLARRWIIASVPTVQTTHTNPWHLHDFVPGQLAELFVDDDWELYQTVQQPSEVAEISVFKLR